MPLSSYLLNHNVIVTYLCLPWFWEGLEARVHVHFVLLFNQTPSPAQLSENTLREERLVAGQVLRKPTGKGALGCLLEAVVISLCS